MSAPQFEWMLTDTCGSTNQGVTGGPNMNLNSVTYSASQSVFSGNAATFSGITSSYGVTDSNANLYNPMGNDSLTVMLWANWAVAPLCARRSARKWRCSPCSTGCWIFGRC